MTDAAGLERMTREQDQRISDVVTREQSRLRHFIRRRVPDPRDAEDILQDVFYELVEANRLLIPIDHARAGCPLCGADDGEERPGPHRGDSWGGRPRVLTSHVGGYTLYGKVYG
jgi:hypothetical protein